MSAGMWDAALGSSRRTAGCSRLSSPSADWEHHISCSARELVPVPIDLTMFNVICAFQSGS